MTAPPTEASKPIPVRYRGPWSFALRCLVDLQLATIVRSIAPTLRTLHGAVLDVGCGESPFRHLLPSDAHYTGVDIPAATAFGMTSNGTILPFDGRELPFPSEHFDHILCTEVLEHAESHERLIAEMHRVLRPGGTFVLTVPFAARVHHKPFDFHRFTRYQLVVLFQPFREVQITPRGDDVAVIANKLVVLALRWVRGATFPLGLVVLPLAGVFLVLGHLSIRLGLGSTDDPLGYTVIARR